MGLDLDAERQRRDAELIRLKQLQECALIARLKGVPLEWVLEFEGVSSAPSH